MWVCIHFGDSLSGTPVTYAFLMFHVNQDLCFQIEIQIEMEQCKQGLKLAVANFFSLRGQFSRGYGAFHRQMTVAIRRISHIPIGVTAKIGLSWPSIIIAGLANLCWRNYFGIIGTQA